ncbi:MAG: hypothetical protein K1X75_06470 [Leptospirales bacterium]|nr:hypothetical protein [Leptospirales bacterium]
MKATRLALLGLGRMGLPLLQRAAELGVDCAGLDLDKFRREQASQLGLKNFASLKDLRDWSRRDALTVLLLPAGPIIDQALSDLDLASGELIADFGNSNFNDSRRRQSQLKDVGVDFLDVGMSGGVEGARHGPSLSVGGEAAAYDRAATLLAALAAPQGLCYAGPPGYGHLVKTIHNGIEYGILQALGEGLHALSAFYESEGRSPELPAILSAWSHGSIIASRLLQDAQRAMARGAQLEASGMIGGGETGGWARDVGQKLGVAMPALDAALAARQHSRLQPELSGRIIAAIRNQFGGHNIGGD